MVHKETTRERIVRLATFPTFALVAVGSLIATQLDQTPTGIGRTTRSTPDKNLIDLPFLKVNFPGIKDGFRLQTPNPDQGNIVQILGSDKNLALLDVEKFCGNDYRYLPSRSSDPDVIVYKDDNNCWKALADSDLNRSRASH